MKSPLKRFDRIIFSLLSILMGVLFAYLFLYGMLFTCRIDTAFIAAEIVSFLRDPLAASLIRLAVGLLLSLIVVRLGERISLRWLTVLSLLLPFVLGCAWVLLYQGMPNNDAGVLHYTAAELARGNPEELQRHVVYMRASPYQAGYMQYSELLQRIFGRRTIIPQGMLNALYLAGANGALLCMTWLSFRDRTVQRLTAVWLMLFLQPVFYTTFLYGNLPGLCLSLWAVALAVHGVQQRQLRWFFIAALLLSIAVVLKPNYLIAALALTLVVSVYALSAKRFAALLAAVVLMAAPLASSRGAQWIFEKRTGFVMGDGAPQTTWLAMGMQESSRAPGWYNNYPIDVMEAADCDLEQVRQLNRQHIQDRLQVFAADPAYAVQFYHTKMVSQWSLTTFETEFTNAVMNSQSAFPALVQNILLGPASDALAGYMEGYTLLLYLSFAAGCFWLMHHLLRRSCNWAENIGPFALLITIFGGFLYHMLFEAKAQYVLFYLPLMIPLAAMGLKQIMGKRS